jgi:hypothetical protein
LISQFLQNYRHIGKLVTLGLDQAGMNAKKYYRLTGANDLGSPLQHINLSPLNINLYELRFEIMLAAIGI